MTINYFLEKELSKYKGIYLETGLSNGDSLHTASKLNLFEIFKNSRKFFTISFSINCNRGWVRVG